MSFEGYEKAVEGYRKGAILTVDPEGKEWICWDIVSDWDDLESEGCDPVNEAT